VDPEGCGVAADLAREVEVAAGDTADVVAGEGDDDVGVGELDVGMVVGRLGSGTDLVDQREPGVEVAGAEAGLDPPQELSPVREAGFAYLHRGQLLSRFSHGVTPLS
jgi:hypothetical protein